MTNGQAEGFTHRVGDLDGSLRTVRVTAPETVAMVLDLVAGRLRREPGRGKWLWPGHGSYSRVPEEAMLSKFCDGCGLIRHMCSCRRFFGDVVTEVPRRAKSDGWRTAAADAAVKAAQLEAENAGREAIARQFSMPAERAGRPVAAAVQDLEWSCKRCGVRTITGGDRPELCGCGCAYFDRLPPREDA